MTRLERLRRMTAEQIANILVTEEEVHDMGTSWKMYDYRRLDGRKAGCICYDKFDASQRAIRYLRGEMNEDK